MATVKNNTFEQVYNASEDAALSSRIGPVICVLAQRGLLVAGFSVKKELLTLHYTGYNKTKPAWELSFFEHLFAHEPLLAAKEKIKAVFVAGNKNMVVPDELYDKAEAEHWLRTIHFIEQGDVIQHYPLKETKANYLLAVPVNITELIRINFKTAVMLPAVLNHFKKAGRQGAEVQCTITAEQVAVTMYNNGQLLWHKVADYVNAEDIAYSTLQVCAEHNIAQAAVALKCNTMSAAEYTFVNGLSQYFPGIAAGDGSKYATNWSGAIKLAHQLFACV